jgi:molybdopterin-containing oxidoreductase family iron-sulfur binding subunit
MEHHHENEHAPQAGGTPLKAEFVKPRHWVELRELSADYWADPQAQEKRGQEFHDKPIETIDLVTKIDSKGLARREFLTVMGASMALAGTACMRKPVHKIIPYVVKPVEVFDRLRDSDQEPRRSSDQDGRQSGSSGEPRHPLRSRPSFDLEFV